MFIREMSFGVPDTKSRAVPLTLSTETPVNRGDYVEILDHTPGSIDLSRAPLPLIVSHDMRTLPVGVVTNLRNEGRQLKGTAIFGTSARAEEVFQDVQAGILRSVSVGYEYTDQGRPAGRSSDTLVFKFCPVEVSAVSVPADPNAGFFRSYSMEYQDQQHAAENGLTRSQNRAATKAAEARRQIEAEERLRVTEIAAMCRAHDCPALGEQLIQDGASIADARGAVLEHNARTRPEQRSLSDPRGRDDYLDMGREARQFSIVRAIQAMATNDWSQAGLERAASRAVARQLGRDPEGFFVPFDTLVRSPYAVGTAGSGTTGGTLVATELLSEAFINVLRARSRVIEAGAMMLPGLVGNVDIPRQTAASQTGWVTEGSALSESEGTFDKLSLSPKTIGTYSQISRNMLLQSTPAIEMIVRGDLAAQLALGIDTAAVNGPGTGGAPTGILNTAGLGSVVGGTNGAQLTFDHLVDLATAVANANADFGSLAYMLNPKAVGWLSKQKASTGQYLWPNRGGNALMNSAPATAIPGATPFGNIGDFGALGYPLAVTNQVPSNLTKGTSSGVCSAVIFGNWNDLIIGEWGTLEIVVNPYDSTAYKAGAVLIRAMQSIDIGVRHAASFAVMTDALTV